MCKRSHAWKEGEERRAEGEGPSFRGLFFPCCRFSTLSLSLWRRHWSLRARWAHPPPPADAEASSTHAWSFIPRDFGLLGGPGRGLWGGKKGTTTCVARSSTLVVVSGRRRQAPSQGPCVTLFISGLFFGARDKIASMSRREHFEAVSMGAEANFVSAPWSACTLSVGSASAARGLVTLRPSPRTRAPILRTWPRCKVEVAWLGGLEGEGDALVTSVAASEVNPGARVSARRRLSRRKKVIYAPT